jgi:hypothetical protein
LHLAVANEKPHLRPLTFAYGLAGSLDPLSGMSVSLPAMDEAAARFLQQARQQEWSSLFSFFQAAETEMQILAKTEKATLQRLEVQDEKDIRWIFSLPERSLRWRQKLPVVVADEAGWLIVEAESFVSLETIHFLRGKNWASRSDFIRSLEQEFQDGTLAFSFRHHLSGTEWRVDQ